MKFRGSSRLERNSSRALEGTNEPYYTLCELAGAVEGDVDRLKTVRGSLKERLLPAFVAYELAQVTCIISPDTQNQGASYAIMQWDGTFVVYDDSGNALWSTGTSGNEGRLWRLVDHFEIVATDKLLAFLSHWYLPTVE